MTFEHYWFWSTIISFFILLPIRTPNRTKLDNVLGSALCALLGPILWWFFLIGLYKQIRKDLK